jgi:hypothetical protein
MSLPINREIIKRLDNKAKSRLDDITIFKNDIDKVKQLDSSVIDKAETKLKIFFTSHTKLINYQFADVLSIFRRVHIFLHTCTL